MRSGTVSRDLELAARQRWGGKIRIARISRRDTQATAGAAISVAGPTVAKAERGLGSVEVFDRLARHYGLLLTLGEDT